MPNPVGGFPKQIQPTVTVDGGVAYSSGDVVGGVIEIPKAAMHKGASTILQTLLVKDVSEQDAALELLLFNELPEQTYTDNSACPTLGDDIAKLVAKITIAAADYVSIGGLAVNSLVGLGRPLTPAKGESSLWAVLVTSGTPTYAADTDLSLVFGFLQA